MRLNFKHSIKTVSKICPETCIVFVSYGRPEIAAKSYNSLVTALSKFRDRIIIIISDATNDRKKIDWALQTDADDIIITPRFTPAATSRNLAIALIMDKYSPKYICMLEDDFEYSEDWYPNLVRKTDLLYGVSSPFGLPYGIFSACDHHVNPELTRKDNDNGITAYIFGAVAYQRFMPFSHYFTILRNWDPDLLGISYAQTGGQTFRNTMRGFCGGIIPGNLSWPIDEDSSASTWSKGKRDPGPPAHSFNVSDYEVILDAVRKRDVYRE